MPLNKETKQLNGFKYFFLTLLILWIELRWPENLSNSNARRTETLDSCFILISSAVYTVISTTGDRTSDRKLALKTFDIATKYEVFSCLKWLWTLLIHWSLKYLILQQSRNV